MRDGKNDQKRYKEKFCIHINNDNIYANLRNKVDLDTLFLYFCRQFKLISRCPKLIIIILYVILVMFFHVRIVSVAGYTTDETWENSPKERAR